MTSRSSFDSKIGLTICSPHCSERPVETREPLHSNCVADRQQVHVVRAACVHGKRGPGGRMRIGDHQQVELGQRLQRFRNARDAVAGMSLHEHALHIVLLRDLILRQQHRVEPARERNAGGLHDLLVVETTLQKIVIDLPDARPMLPRAFDQAVVERQRHDIEADVGGALHVVVAAQDVGAHAGAADIAGHQQRDAACAHIGGADRVLGLAHAPDQRRRASASRTSWRRARAARRERRTPARPRPESTFRPPCGDRRSRRRAA